MGILKGMSPRQVQETLSFFSSNLLYKTKPPTRPLSALWAALSLSVFFFIYETAEY